MKPEEMVEDDEHEANVYGESARESMLSNDEIDPEEEAFMQGYEEADEEAEESEDDDYEDAFE